MYTWVIMVGTVGVLDLEVLLLCFFDLVYGGIAQLSLRKQEPKNSSLWNIKLCQ